MTLDDAINGVEHIRRLSADDEAAHSAEDRLRTEFIRHVANYGPVPLRDMAAEILKTESLKFARWCA